MEPGELVEACGRAVAERLRELLGDELVAAYLVGSGALGGVALGRSDVDVVAVCAGEPPEERRLAVAASLGELAMTWPLRGLEFVLYARAAVAAPERSPRFAINLNVGPRMPYRLSLDRAEEPSHWFLLDLAILRDRGRVLAGPPPGELVGPIPRRWLLEALRDSMAWHRAEGVWSSKNDAGAWAMARTGDPATVEAAVAARHGDPSAALEPARVEAFVGEALQAVERALETGG